MRYHTELQQISSAQRLLKHMYNTVNTHQTIARSFYKPQLPPPLVPIGGPTVRHRSTASVPSHHPSKLPCRRSLAAVVRTSSSDHHPSSHTATSQLTSEAHSTLPVAPLSAERLLGSTSLSVKVWYDYTISNTLLLYYSRNQRGHHYYGLTICNRLIIDID